MIKKLFLRPERRNYYLPCSAVSELQETLKTVAEKITILYQEETRHQPLSHRNIPSKTKENRGENKDTNDINHFQNAIVIVV